MKTIKGFKLRPLGDEFILVGESVELVNYNKMLTLNETAAFLWRKASEDPERDFDAKMMADWLCKEYDVTPQQALQDSEHTLEQWKEAEIVRE